MNLKKLFATSAILTLAVSTFAPAINSAKANYNAEINSAYSYAYEKNVTTLPTVESAFPMGKAIRSHVAKMISNWALVVLNKQPNEAITPVFTDIAGESEELQGYIKKSAQQGLMGQGITEFMPKQEVTRAQFGTALSRALFGNKYDGGTPYYVNHLENLKKLGVMNDITNPERPILRYEIWLMLQRSEKLTTKDTDDGLTPEQILGCLAADDYLACLEKAKEETKEEKEEDKKDEVVRKGDLNVSVSNSKNVVSIPGTATVVLGQVSFKGSEDIELYSVELSRVGLGSNSNIKGIWFEKDGKRVSNKTNLFSDSMANVRFSNGYTVKAKETLDLVVQLEGSVGSEYAFRVDSVDSSAKDVVISPDTTSTFRTTAYKLASLTTKSLTDTVNNEYRLGKTAYEFGKFELVNNSPVKSDRTIKVQSINLRNVLGGDISNLEDIKILRDGKDLDAKVSVDGKYVTFVVNDTIDAARKAVYTIMATPIAVEEQNGDHYKLQIRNAADIIAVEVGQDVAFRPLVEGQTVGSNFASLDLGEYTIKGGSLVLTRDSNFPATVNAGKGYSDVVIAKGKFTMNNGVHLENFTLKRATAETASLLDNINRAYLVIGNQRYQSTDITADKIEFDAEFYLQKGVNDVEITVDLKNNAPATSISFENIAFANTSSSFGTSNAYYTNADETPITLSTDGVGSIRVAKLNVQDDRFGFTKTSSYNDTNIVAGNTDEVVLFVGEVKNSTNRNIDLTSLTVAAAAQNNVAPDNKKIADATVYINGVPVGGNVVLTNKQTANTTIGEFNSLSTSLAAGETAKIEIKAIPSAGLLASEQYKMVAQLKALSNGNELTSAKLPISVLSVKGSADVKVYSNTLLKDSIVKIAEMSDVAIFNTNIINDSASIDGLKVELGAAITAANLQSVEVFYKKQSDSAWIQASVASFDNTTVNTEITVELANDLTLSPALYNFKVRAAYSNFNANPQNTSVKLDIDKITLMNDGNPIQNANGQNAEVALSYVHLLATAYPTLSVENKVNNDNTHSFDLVVTNPSNSNAQITITEIDVDGAVVEKETAADMSNGANNSIAISAGDKATFKVSGADAKVKSISFKVTDDQGNVSEYSEVKGYTNMAAWGDLSL